MPEIKSKLLLLTRFSELSTLKYIIIFLNFNKESFSNLKYILMINDDVKL